MIFFLYYYFVNEISIDRSKNFIHFTSPHFLLPFCSFDCCLVTLFFGCFSIKYLICLFQIHELTDFETLKDTKNSLNLKKIFAQTAEINEM